MKELQERFIYQYFSFSAAVGNIMSPEQEKQAFFSLAKAYLIDEKSAQELWEVVDCCDVRQIDTVKDYLRYCRSKQYLQEVLQIQEQENALVSQVIALKGSALSKLVECELILENEENSEIIKSNLVNVAGTGCICALKTLGLMQIYGIGFDKDQSNGLKNLISASKWNDVDGSMLYLYYSNDNKQECFDRLLTVLEIRYNSSLANAVKEAYPQESKNAKRHKIAGLIEKAFNMSVLLRDKYAAPKSRILFSDILTYQYKEQAIYSMDDKQQRSSICDLPLKLATKSNIDLNLKAFEGMVLNREQEQNQILREAQNFDLRKMPNYRPLCISADCHLLAQHYINAICNLAPNAHIEIIEVGELGGNDIEKTSNNIFVRKCDEDKTNIYILSFRGEIEQEAMNLALDFLKSAKRRAFGLVSPAVQLDLSSILPICVCDKSNAGILDKLCNVVDLASITKEEKYVIIDDLLANKARLYDIEQISMNKDVKTEVAKLSADNIAKALDKAILANRIKSGKLNLDENMLGKILNEFKTINKYGFGGSIQ